MSVKSRVAKTISAVALVLFIIGDGRTHGAPFRGYGYVPLRNGGNVVTRMGTQQQLFIILFTFCGST